MNIRKLVSFAMLATFLCNPLSALAAALCYTPLVNAFSNGIQNTRSEACKNMRSLQTETAHLKASENLLLYHANGRDGESGMTGFLLDMLEVFVLLSHEAVGNDPAREAEAMAIFHGYRNPDARPGVLYQQLLNYALQAEQELTEKFSTLNTEDTMAESVTDDVKKLSLRLEKGVVIMLAAHSQGALWANAALTRLTQEQPTYAKKIHLASAGAAASYVWQTPGSTMQNGHITSHLDLVISSLRVLASSGNQPMPLASNASHLLTPIEPLGHGFIDIYLDTTADTGQKFIELYTNGADFLKQQGTNAQVEVVQHDGAADSVGTGCFTNTPVNNLNRDTMISRS